MTTQATVRVELTRCSNDLELATVEMWLGSHGILYWVEGGGPTRLGAEGLAAPSRIFVSPERLEEARALLDEMARQPAMSSMTKDKGPPRPLKPWVRVVWLAIAALSFFVLVLALLDSFGLLPRR